MATTMTFEWDGDTPHDIAEQLRDAGDILEKRLEEAMVAIVKRVEGTAKVLAPVDSGTLRESIGSVTRNLAGTAAIAGVVGADVKYAVFQEFGTSVMDAQPFLRPAFRRNRNFIETTLANAVESAYEEAGF